jgi:myo-inositol-1(or 4)-monophosphatase
MKIQPMLPALDELAALVKSIAREELLPRFTHAECRLKADGSIVTEADLAVQNRLAKALLERYPQYQLLGEEMDLEKQKELLAQGGEGLWCLDPVDGTSNFAAGFPFFCISLALLVGAEPVLGLVYDPIRDECFTAGQSRGAWLNGARLTCTSPSPPLKRCLGAVDFKRLGSGLAAELAVRPPYSSQRYLGSGALEWCWLAASRFHVYLHGHQKLWDYAAGALILAESGGIAETWRGEAIFRPESLTCSVIAALDETLFKEWRDALAGWLAKDQSAGSGLGRAEPGES